MRKAAAAADVAASGVYERTVKLKSDAVAILRSETQQKHGDRAGGGGGGAGGGGAADRDGGGADDDERWWADYREVPVFPDARDVLGSAPPALPENIVEGKYAHVMQYLATHFHLLREDCLAPLRDGLAAFHRGERSFDVQVYESVRLVGLHCSRAESSTA